jgi:hypothetical protein
VYQETTASGQKSNFNKIVKRETVMERAGDKRSRARKTGARGKNEKRGARATAGAKKAAGVNALPAQASRARVARVPGHRRPWRENRAAAK